MAIESATGKPKTGRNIFCFEIRQLYESLLLSEPRGKQVQDIDQLNSHPTYTRPPSALCKIGGDALDEFRHDEKHLGCLFPLVTNNLRLISESPSTSRIPVLRGNVAPMNTPMAYSGVRSEKHGV
jgi:hypothetical protein